MAGSKLAGKNYAYTLAEIIIVMLVIALIVAVSIRITKMKLDNIVTYTYYSAYSTLRNISRNMISDFKPDDETYMTTYNILDNYKLANNIFSGLTVLFESKAFGGRYYETEVEEDAGLTGAIADTGRQTSIISKNESTKIFFINLS